MTRWLFIVTFVVGLVLGIGSTYFAPDLLGPYLPSILQRKGELVRGNVVAEQEKVPWLLLTINTPQGAILATFKEKVDEIALLVEVGDQIELFLRKYEPFVEDPRINRVRKGEGRIEIAPERPQETQKEEALAAPSVAPQESPPPDIEETVEAPEEKAPPPPLPPSQEESLEPSDEGETKAASDVEESSPPALPAGAVEEKVDEEKQVGGEESPLEPAAPTEGETAP
ncbi:MAG: hypothetical protein ACE5D4_06830 [Thermodesulfobacteriota bacterium]